MNTLDALKIAREAMKERRAYCEQWEYKYGHEWDNEDGYIQDAIDKLSALEAEKPAEDARSLAIDISLGALDRAEFWEVIVPKRIRSFSESYHAKKCAECKEMKKLYVKFGNESPPDACLSCGRRCPNDCPLDETPEAPK